MLIEFPPHLSFSINKSSDWTIKTNWSIFPRWFPTYWDTSNWICLDQNKTQSAFIRTKDEMNNIYVTKCGQELIWGKGSQHLTCPNRIMLGMEPSQHWKMLENHHSKWRDARSRQRLPIRESKEDPQTVLWAPTNKLWT